MLTSGTPTPTSPGPGDPSPPDMPGPAPSTQHPAPRLEASCLWTRPNRARVQEVRPRTVLRCDLRLQPPLPGAPGCTCSVRPGRRYDRPAVASGAARDAGLSPWDQSAGPCESPEPPGRGEPRPSWGCCCCCFLNPGPILLPSCRFFAGPSRSGRWRRCCRCCSSHTCAMFLRGPA